MPVSPLPKEVCAAYPNAKYILSVRSSGEEGWFKSMQATMWHFRRDWWRTLFRTLIYPVAFLRRMDDHIQQIGEVWSREYGSVGPQIYDAHNEVVKKLVPREQLLVYNVREGWEPLCRFLEVEVPEVPFPKCRWNATCCCSESRDADCVALRSVNDTESVTAVYVSTRGRFC